jgi:hypothetical protein
MLSTLSYVLSLGSLICFILVLVKLFQSEGVGKGILGLICGIYTFIWGWMHQDKVGVKNLMLIWTLLIIASIVLGVMGGVQMMPKF